MRRTGRKAIAIIAALVFMMGLFPVMAEETQTQTAETTAAPDIENVINAEEGVIVPEQEFVFTLAALSPEDAPMPEDITASIRGKAKSVQEIIRLEKSPIRNRESISISSVGQLRLLTDGLTV